MSRVNNVYIYFTLPCRIIALFGACANSRKNHVLRIDWKCRYTYIIYITVNFCVRLYSSRGACSLIGTCAKKSDNTVTARNKSKNSAWNILMYSKKLLLFSHSHNWCLIHSWKLILIRNLCLQKRNPFHTSFFLHDWEGNEWSCTSFIVS